MPTYCGLLDDLAQRHRDVSIESIQELNEQLIVAVLFGEPLLVNDGYVLAHEAVQQAILYPHRSPLRRLVETGYVKILTRNGGELALLADLMADNKITAAQERLKQPRYRERYHPALREWSDRLRSSDLG